MLFITCFFFVTNLHAQHGKQNFSNCAAAFLNKNMVVDEYSTTGKCVIAASVSGELTVRPAEMMDDKTVKAGDKIPFKIAIRDGGSKTLMLFLKKRIKTSTSRKCWRNAKKATTSCC